MKINVNDYDELNSLAVESGVLLYLQELFQTYGASFCREEFLSAEKEVPAYLRRRQMDNLLRFKDILESAEIDFVTKNK